jgi:hypothetical protein
MEVEQHYLTLRSVSLRILRDCRAGRFRSPRRVTLLRSDRLTLSGLDDAHVFFMPSMQFVYAGSFRARSGVIGVPAGGDGPRKPVRLLSCCVVEDLCRLSSHVPLSEQRVVT